MSRHLFQFTVALLLSISLLLGALTWSATSAGLPANLSSLLAASGPTIQTLNPGLGRIICHIGRDPEADCRVYVFYYSGLSAES